MEKAKIWWISCENLSFNPRFRYSVIEFKQNYYLLDNNQAWWGNISPIFTWIIPEKVMKIKLSKEEVDALLLNKEEQIKSDEIHASTSGIGVFISVVLGPMFIFPMAERFFGFYLPTVINMLISLIIIIAMVVYKSRLSKSAVQIIDTIGTENLSETRLSIVPESIGQAIKILTFRIFFLMMSLGLFIFLSTEANEVNVIGWLGGLMGLFGVLYSNTFLRKFARYKIKILD